MIYFFLYPTGSWSGGERYWLRSVRRTAWPKKMCFRAQNVLYKMKNKLQI